MHLSTHSKKKKISVTFIWISLLVNIVVLIAVFVAIVGFGASAPVIHTWGPSTSSRGILSSIYLSMFVLSSILLAMFVHNPRSELAKSMLVGLLLVQVCYKITTPFTVGIKNPCVISNLCIAMIHIVTLCLICKRS